MKVKFEIQDNRIIGYQTFPITDDMIEIDNLPDDILSGEYGFNNNQIVKLGYTSEKQKELNEEKLNNLRVLREPLLRAYDTYKINVLYGIENVSTLSGENAKNEIDKWYKKILDLDEISINNPPEKIKYYL